MFERTPNGLANEHMFYKVDYMVYCEGESPTTESLSLDEKFWIKIFATVKKKVYVKSKGSKKNITPYIDYIKSGILKNTIVALDADYDFYFNHIDDHPQIFYTLGYSWESDAIHLFEFEKILSLFCSTRDVCAAKKEFDKFIKKNTTIFWRASLIDMRYIFNERPLFNRTKPNSIIETDDRKQNKNPPQLKRGTLIKNARSLTKKSSNITTLPFNGPSNGMLYFFGKTTLNIIYRWFSYFSSKFDPKHSVPLDLFRNQLIEAIELMRETNIISKHYQRALSRIC